MIGGTAAAAGVVVDADVDVDVDVDDTLPDVTITEDGFAPV